MDKYSYQGQESDNLLFAMKERQLFLQEIINETQKWLKNHSQKQTLCVKQRKDKVLYYAAQGNGKQKYLRQNQYKIVTQLAQNSYDANLQSCAEKELQIINTFLQQYPKIPADKLFERLNKNRKAIVDPLYPTDQAVISNFLNNKPVASDYRPEGLTQKTENGELVRSKSEVLIANYLLHANVPYIYELPIVLDNRIIHPDFTVLNVRTREILYWEHLGMMDNKEYIVSAQQSLSQNHEQLWIPAERGYAASNSMKWMESDPLSLSAK